MMPQEVKYNTSYVMGNRAKAEDVSELPCAWTPEEIHEIARKEALSVVATEVMALQAEIDRLRGEIDDAAASPREAFARLEREEHDG